MSTRGMDVLAAVREHIRLLERGVPEGSGVLKLGISEIEERLPWRGLLRGALHEIVGDPAAGLGFVAALLGSGSPDSAVLWCRARGNGSLPYGPGLTRFGITPDRFVLLRVERKADAFWAMEEALRCRRLAAVLGQGAEPTPIEARRLQLAAEAGGTPAFLLLPPSARPPPSIAVTRWRVDSASSRPPFGGRPCWRVALTRCRSGGEGEWLVEWDDEALRLDLVAALADRSLAAAAG